MSTHSLKSSHYRVAKCGFILHGSDLCHEGVQYKSNKIETTPDVKMEFQNESFKNFTKIIIIAWIIRRLATPPTIPICKLQKVGFNVGCTGNLIGVNWDCLSWSSLAIACATLCLYTRWNVLWLYPFFCIFYTLFSFSVVTMWPNITLILSLKAPKDFYSDGPNKLK